MPRAILKGLAVAALAAIASACGGGSPTAPVPTSGEGFFENAGARLHFLLDVPAGAGPFPAVVISHGAGRSTTTDGASYLPFLRERGLAVLRYDKRGVGRSTGTYRGVSAANSEAQIAELGGDLAAALDALASRPEIDAHRLGFLGTSQAGWVMVAALEKNPRARFAIAVSGSVLPVGVNIRYEDLRDLPIDEAYAQLAGFSGTRGYDPQPILQRLGAPTLWLLGEQDRLVPTRECLTILDRLRALGAPVDFVAYPDAGHGLLGVAFWPDVDAFLRRHALP